MARLPDLVRFGAEHGLKIISIADLIAYRRAQRDPRVEGGRGHHPHARTASSAPTRTRAQWTVARTWRLVLGDIGDGRDVLTRVHSECLTGDVFASLRCDCGEQLHRSMEIIGKEGRGVVLYIRGHEGRAIGLTHKLRAYELQDQGRDTVRGEHRAGVPGRSARVRDRRADPGRPRRSHDAAAHEQSRQARRPRGLRALHLRADPDRDRADPREHRIPAHEAREDGPPARRPARRRRYWTERANGERLRGSPAGCRPADRDRRCALQRGHHAQARRRGARAD